METTGVCVCVCVRVVNNVSKRLFPWILSYRQGADFQITHYHHSSSIVTAFLKYILFLPENVMYAVQWASSHLAARLP